jgi:hypothetical protein
MHHPPTPLLARPPSESLTSPRLTRPSTNQKSTTVISRILEQIERRRTGHYSSDEPWVAFQLYASEFKELEELIGEDGFVQNKVRYDSNISLVDPYTLC